MLAEHRHPLWAAPGTTSPTRAKAGSSGVHVKRDTLARMKKLDITVVVNILLAALAIGLSVAGLSVLGDWPGR